MIGRRLVVVAVMAILAILAATIVAQLPPVRTIGLTAALLPGLIGMDAARPGREEPTVATATYGSPADRIDIWMPPRADGGSGSKPPYAGVVLALGVHPQPIDHPDITRVARAISRLGVIVGIPDSTALRELRVTPDEPSHLADAVLFLRQWPEVDPARVGLAGFSAGASIGLVAAADSRIADELRFVSSFGGYADTERLLVDVATRTSTDGAAVRDWLPDPGIRADVLELISGTIHDEISRERLRSLLSPIVASDSAPTGPRPLEAAEFNGDALQIYLLFTAASRTRAESAVQGLSDQLRCDLAAISPLTVASKLRAPVFLLHGEPDTAIPVEHAETLVDALGQRVARYTRFGQFGHEQPGLTGLDPSDASDVWELALYLRDIVAATLE